MFKNGRKLKIGWFANVAFIGALNISFYFVFVCFSYGSAPVKITETKEEITTIKNFPYTTFDKVWNAAILVLMQEDVIMEASKDTGVIKINTERPCIIKAIRGDVVSIQIYNIKIAKTIFYKIATQVYSGEKWGYLYK